MNTKRIIVMLAIATMMFHACNQKNKSEEEVVKEAATWAEKLGYPAGKKVIMLHADDAGLCEEANIAIKKYLKEGHIQSASAMPPCPKFDEFILWAKENPQYDVGLHLTFTSEFQRYRWSTVLPVDQVPSLNDEDGKIWLEISDVLANATAEDVAKEIRGQIDKSIALGFRPSHIDTHEGTLFAHPDYTKAFLQIAMEYNIPANIMDFSDSTVIAFFKKKGIPISDEYIKYIDAYTLPKLDFIVSIHAADTYEEKIENFQKMVKSLRPGLTEVLSFHPAIETEHLKEITYAWQQRVWEAKMFSDLELIQFLKDEGIIFTNWKEIMKRFNKLKSDKK